MAHINFTLDQEEIIELLSTSRDDAFRTLFEKSLNALLRAESGDTGRIQAFQDDVNH